MDTRLARVEAVHTNAPSPELGRRVASEFREMPGLRITVSQASRLFSLDSALCRGVLDALVHDGVLFADRGVFQCVGVGRRHA